MTPIELCLLKRYINFLSTNKARGSFDTEDILYTSLALTFFAIGVPAFALIKVLSNF